MTDAQPAGEMPAEAFPEVEKRGPEPQLELEADSSAFEALERDFQEVLQELLGDESLERFRLEYEKLHRALKRSHEQEKRLVKKARELNAEILTNQARVKSALKLSAEDQKTISTLQKQLDETYKNLYASQEKEARSKEEIKQMKEEMGTLTKLVERGAGLSVNQENMVKELRQQNEELERQVTEQSTRITTIEMQLRELHRQREELKKSKEDSVSVIEDLKAQVNQKETELTRETRRRERTQKELQDTRVQLEEHTRKEEEMANRIQTSSAHAQSLEAQLSETQSTMQKYLRDYDHLFNRAQKLTEDLEEQIRRNKGLQGEKAELEKVVTLKNAEVSRVNTEKGLLDRIVQKERRTAQHYKHQLEQSRTPLLQAQAEIEALQKELQEVKRQKEQIRNEVESLEREKNVQIRATAQAEQRTKEREEAIRDVNRNVGSLELELQHHKEEISGLRKMIFQLEKKRERLSNEASDWRNQYVQSQEEVKLKDIAISDLQKKLTEWEHKHKQQQQMYETVRADRNVYSKNLIDAQDELAEMKKKFKILNHQIEQLKEEIAVKDQALVKEHFDREQVNKLREQLQSELSRKNQLLNKNKVLLEQQANEIEKLTSFIKRVDEEALTQRKEYDQVVNERDILGTQLIRRNDELALLYEKLRIQQSALRQGEAQYAARLQDMRMMKLKIRAYESDLRMVKSNSGQVEDMKRQILTLRRELLQEKTKVTALSEELECPMNVHRWRKLEGSDPAAFEMIQKVQTLQRRLIAKTEEVVEKDLVIQEKEKQVNELQAALDRHPGPEMAEQLSVYQSSLRDKVRQLKAMAAELNMYQAQVNEYKYEIERLNRELRDTKKKYYTQRRREQIAKEISFTLNTKSSPQQLQLQQQELAKLANPRYAGGGYAIR